MAFELPALPYAQDALEPHISANTLSFHYGKHHNTYVVNLNKLLGDAAGSSQDDLEAVIKGAAGDASKAGLFNNAAQVWNHTFYWNCMKSNGGGAPTGDLAAKIDATFGSFDKFKEEFTQACITAFGSGWGWLVIENGELKITKTIGADTPVAHGQTALLTCDVWEHAYYLDFQNLRPKYVATFLDELVNWDYVAEQLANA